MAVTVESARQYQEKVEQKEAAQNNGVSSANGTGSNAPTAPAKKKMDYKKVILIGLGIGALVYLGYKYFTNKAKGKAISNGVGLSGTYTE